MNKVAAVTALVFLLYAGADACALGKKESGNTPAGGGSRLQNVEVTGKVRMVGNSPMTSLVISGEDREWYVEPDEQDKLIHLQQQTVTVRAGEYYLDRVFANGRSAGRYYYLKNIVIVDPEH